MVVKPAVGIGIIIHILKSFFLYVLDRNPTNAPKLC